MRHVRTLLLVLVLAGGFAAAAPAASWARDGTGTVSGTAVDALGGPAVVGATVYVFGSSNDVLTTALTGADGHYTATGVPSGPVTSICVDGSTATSAPEGYVSVCGTNTTWWGPGVPPTMSTGGAVLTAGGTLEQDFEVIPAGGLSGRVTAEGGTPLAGVVVQTYVSGVLREATTGADGRYHLRSLHAGSAGVCFAARGATGGPVTTGYLSECNADHYWNDDGFPAADPVEITPGVTSSLSARLAPGGAVSGVVRDAADGTGLERFQVQLSWPGGAAYAITKADGAYRFARLPAGTDYRLCVDATWNLGHPPRNTHQSQCFSGQPYSTLGGGDPVTVTPGVVTRADMDMLRVATIGGTVRNDAGTPLAGVSVVTYRDGRPSLTTTTAADGSYEITGLYTDVPGYVVCFVPTATTTPPTTGGYRTECSGDRLVPTGTPLPVKAAAPVPVSPGTASTSDAVLTAGAEFTGVVKGAADGRPLVGARVLLVDDAGVVVASQATTSPNGRYDFAGVAPRRTYRVCVLSLGFTTNRVSTGYASQCSGGAAWDGAQGTATGTPLDANVARSRTVTFSLAPGASFSGSLGVTDSESLVVVDAAGRPLMVDTAFAKPRSGLPFAIVGLDPAAGPYRLCGRQSQPYAVGPGRAAACWSATTGNVPWDGSLADVPSSASDIAVTAGADTPGVTLTSLVLAGGITGTVHTGSTVASGVSVQAFAPSGSLVASSTTTTTGAYSLSLLNAATAPYRVCAKAPAGYTSRCWRAAAWTGSGPPPADAASRAVTTGRFTPGVDVTLPRR